ncbi:hypothetical protein [Archaeoglobus profundus]|uniref:Uncharacterized protein n=1 Tax=Archaeoglobus profundus (strain DSM 5631 / JCM 9629 / NBRC 100127 / Av18) TaxID=572546 RepID=D2RHZ9_ARCPA|nr:hypothetical protein [Archaeoglobus profundus]ADB57924.1 hypothetical protein Arcpr_0861 [Archaeoglobus profundus DSM 5631]
MRILLILFSLLMLVGLAVAGNVTVNETAVNQTLNQTNLNLSINVTPTPIPTLTPVPTPTPTPTPTPANQTNMTLEELVKVLQKQVEDLRKQNEILREEIKKLREENKRLKEKLAKLERRPITWEDVENKVDEYYVQFTYWTGWLWPILTFYLILRYRKPAIETEEERIQEAVEKIVREKQREWFCYQVRKKGIETVAEDDTELAIFRSLGIYTIGDLLSKSDEELIEAFKEKYKPTADLLEHFKNRLKEIKEKLKEVDSDA